MPTRQNPAYTTEKNGHLHMVRKESDNTWSLRVKDPTSKYAEPGGWVTLAVGFETRKGICRTFNLDKVTRP